MKKTLSTIAMAAILACGATFANAEGIIVSDRTEGIIVSDKATPCTDAKEGIIISDFFAWIEGIIVSDKADNDCTSKEGIIISDRTEGIIVSD